MSLFPRLEAGDVPVVYGCRFPENVAGYYEKTRDDILCRTPRRQLVIDCDEFQIIDEIERDCRRQNGVVTLTVISRDEVRCTKIDCPNYIPE